MKRNQPTRRKEPTGRITHRLHVKITAFLLVFAMACTAMASLPMEVFAADGDFTIENGVLKKYKGSGGDVVIPNSVISIGNNAFYECRSLTSVTIPDSVTSIGSRAFAYCHSLANISIPNSVTNIQVEAFSFCSSLTNITIPASVTNIGGKAFDACDSLTSITVDSGNAQYSSLNGVLYNKNQTELLQCPGGKSGSFSILNSVTNIKSHAFRYCSKLTSITMPNSVTSIGDDAFEYCSGLTSVIIPDSVTSIGYEAFYGCSSLTSVTIGNSVTSIGNKAFCGCSSLTNITIPDSVTSIGGEAFCGCSSLTSINVDCGNAQYSSLNGVLYNKNQTELLQCPGGKSGSFSILNSVTSIGKSAFCRCSKLTSVSIGNSVTSIGENAFYDCDSLTSVTIGNSVTSIGEWVFYDCDSLTSVTIGNSVTSIGYEAFYSCSSLTKITIPDSVTNIKSYAFMYCSKLTSVTIGNSVTSIGDQAFYSCSSLTSITIPNSVTSIGSYAFADCDSLKSVTIPDSVISIGYEAFSCKLTDVYYSGSQDDWNKISIGSSNSALTNATIHYNSTGPEDDPASANVSFSETEYTCKTGESFPISATVIANQLPKNLTWTCSDSEAVSFSGTSVMDPAVTGTENEWWVSVYVTAGSTTGDFDISLYSSDYLLGTVKLVILPDNSITLRLLDAATGEDITGLIGNVTYKPKNSASMALLSPEDCPSEGVWQIPGEYYPLDTLMIGVHDLTTNPETNASYHKYGGLITLNDVNAEINHGVLTVKASSSGGYVEKTGTSSVEILSGDFSMTLGERKKLYAVVKPYTNFNQNVAWNSSDENAVYVLDDGTVLALKIGTATITATANGQTDSIKVTVNPTGASLISPTKFIEKDDKLSFRNNRNYFSYPRYYISQQYYDILTRNLSPSNIQDIKRQREEAVWGGSCYGMSAVSVINKYNRLPDLSTYGAKKLSKLPSPKKSTNNGGEVESLINYYQFITNCDNVAKFTNKYTELYNSYMNNGFHSEEYRNLLIIITQQLVNAGIAAEYSNKFSIMTFGWINLNTEYIESEVKHQMPDELIAEITEVLGSERASEFREAGTIILSFGEVKKLESLNIHRYLTYPGHAVMITGIEPNGDGKYKLWINDPNDMFFLIDWDIDTNTYSICPNGATGLDYGALTLNPNDSTIQIKGIIDDINIIDYISLKNGLQTSGSRSIKANFLKSFSKAADLPASYIDTSCADFSLSDGTNTYSSRDSQSPVYWTKGEADEGSSRKYKVELDQYTIAPLNPSGADSTHDFTVYADGYYGRMKAQGLKSYTVTKNGHISLDAKGEYQLTVASDTMPSGKWDTLKLSGSMNAPVTVDVTAEGFVISGDIANAKIICEGKDMASRNLTYTLVANKALVTAKDGEIAVLTDKNNDGTFETNESVQGGVAVTYLELQERAFELQTGETAKMTPVITPSNAANKKVYYTSNDTSVATVAADGTVTAIGIGRTTVTAKTDDGGWTASCEVVVPLTTQSVALSASAKTLNVGESFALTATVTPANSTDYIEWSVEEENQNEDEDERESIINIDSDGNVLACNPGKATVTAKVGEKTASCTVTVKAPVTGIELLCDKLTMARGMTQTMNYLVFPANTTDTSAVTWTSSDEKVVKVTDGKFTAVSPGTATVTASKGGFSAKCVVTVTVTQEALEITGEYAVVGIGKTLTLNAAYVPADATKPLKLSGWHSSDESIATVDANGKVTGVSAGTAVISTSTQDKINKAEFTITVASLSLQNNALTIATGETKELAVTVKPSTLTMEYASSDQSVVTVDGSGKIKGIKAGKATVTAKVKDSSVTAKCDVTVFDLKITTQPTDQTIKLGDSLTLSLKAEGNGLTYQWYFKKSGQTSFSPWSGRTHATETCTPNATWDGIQLYCVVKNSAGKSVQSDTITITVKQDLKITTQPTNKTIKLGDSLTLSLKAEGNGLTYQWYFKKSGQTSFSPWSGRTHASETCTPNATWDGIQLYCMVKDSAGKSVQSDTITITVKQDLKITTQPTDQTIKLGDSLTLSLKAEGNGLTYQWYFKKAGQTSFSPWSGRTHASETCTPNATWDGIQLYCIVKDSTGKSVQSNTVKITVTQELKITTQPTGKTIKLGDSLTISLKAEGNGLTYQWYFKKSGQTSFSPWSGRTHATETCTPNATWDGIQLYCIVKDSTGKSVQSNTVKITVTQGLKITTQPTGKTIKLGDSLTLSLKAEGDGLTYQWYFKKSGQTSFSAWSGRTHATETCTPNESWNGIQLYCILKDSAGKSVQSNTVKIIFSDVITIVTQPANVTAKTGENVKFTVKAEGAGLTYQWYYKKAGAADWSKWGERNTASTAATSNAGWDGMQVRCVVKNSGGKSATSNAAMITLSDVLAITQQPSNVSVKAGDSVKFSVKAKGEGITYQWQYKKSGATSWSNWGARTTASTTATANATWNGMKVRCVVKDSKGNSVTSNAATITIK